MLEADASQDNPAVRPAGLEPATCGLEVNSIPPNFPRNPPLLHKAQHKAQHFRQKRSMRVCDDIS